MTASARGAGDEAQLAVGDRLGRDGIDRSTRRAGREREHVEHVAAVDALGRRRALLAPPGIDAPARCRRRRSPRRPAPPSPLPTSAAPSARRPAARPSARRCWPAHWRGSRPDWRSGRPSCRNDAHRSRKSQTRSKLMAPRQPSVIVGRSCFTRGPSEATRTSAANAALSAATSSASPLEPDSSPISMMKRALKPRRPPRSAITASSAAMLMVCWPLLSAVPRPYRRSPSRAVTQGPLPLVHWSSRPRMTSPWP